MLDGQPIVYDFRERVDLDARAVSRPPSSSPSRCPPGEKGIRSSETNKNRIILAPQCELIMKKSSRKMDEIFVPLFFQDRISSIVHCHPHTVPAEGSGQRSRCTSGQRSRCSFGRERGWLFLSCSETTFRLLPSASCLPLSAFHPLSSVFGHSYQKLPSIDRIGSTPWTIMGSVGMYQSSLSTSAMRASARR